MSIAPLLLLWLFGRSQQAAAPSRGPAAPLWPTAASPPPMPAFQAQPPAAPAAPTADTATPLAQLHAAPPEPPPVHTSPAAPERAASPAAKKAAPAPAPAPKPKAKPNPKVLAIQKQLIAKGAKLKPDGLMGPKTASAIKSFARRKKVSGEAAVDLLSTPHIP
jgi:hypothetical protein